MSSTTATDEATDAAPPLDAPAAAKLLTALEVGLNQDLLERQTEIKTAVVALASRKHHFCVGPPGVAKSLLVRRLAARIEGIDDGEYFQWLFTKFTTPEEVFGPPSVKRLKENDEYVRNTARKMPVARLAFLDEIFKASSSILNALLTIMNERLFFNNEADSRVPLECIFAASNELPHGDELNALWDRLHFRHEVAPMHDGGNFIKMLKLSHSLEPTPALTLNQLFEIQELVRTVELPSDIYDAMKELRDSLRKNCGIEPSERRYVECIPIIQATAIAHGRQVAEVDDMRLLRHVLWYRIEDQKVVSQEVLQLSNPIDKAANDLLELVETLGAELDDAISNADNGKALAKTAVEIHGKLKKAKGELNDLKKQAKATGRKSETLEILSGRFTEIGHTLMDKCFGMADGNDLKDE